MCTYAIGGSDRVPDTEQGMYAYMYIIMQVCNVYIYIYIFICICMYSCMSLYGRDLGWDNSIEYHF